MAMMELKKSEWEMGEFPNAFDRWLRLAPSESHWNSCRPLVLAIALPKHSGWKRGAIYRDSQDGQSGDNSSGEDQCDNLWRAFGVLFESMMDFWAFSISYLWLFPRTCYSRTRVGVEYKIKSMVVVGGGGAEWCDYKRDRKWCRSGQQLVGDILLGLKHSVSSEGAQYSCWMICWPRGEGEGEGEGGKLTSSTFPFPLSLIAIV